MVLIEKCGQHLERGVSAPLLHSVENPPASSSVVPAQDGHRPAGVSTGEGQQNY